MPLSLADVLSAQAGGGPVYEGGPDANVTPAGVLSALGLGGPSWLDAARKQTGADIAAYQRGGVPEMMADTGPTQELAGGFVGSTTPSKGIRAYHGSPYDFEKFDISKIGTGEGAQSYGHGLYFAENPQTAESYKAALSPSRSKLPDDILSLPPDMRQAVTTHARTDADAATAAKRAQYMSSNLRTVDPEKVTDMVQRIRDAERGRMYEVNINAEPGQFLDWRKPVGSDPQLASFVQQAGKSFPHIRDNPELTGQGLYEALAQHRGGQPTVASEALKEVGIPGIRYLDQGSLGMLKFGPDAAGNWDFTHTAPSQQTHNYVVFNPEIVDILKKYGLAGLTMGGVLSAAGQPPAPAQ